ncbi:MAG: RraA family protein [bacterium]|jgi:regulator of RNase E activity RraA|nr:RraA family protein [bacterium]
MKKTLTAEQLEALRQLDAPTVANAIETFDVQPRNTGFMSPDIGCIFPDLGVMVGYACTAIIAADHQPPKQPKVSRSDWWQKILATPAPRVVVMQDSDPQPIGSFWGEVQGNIHKALGCSGVVTNGGVRDLDEATALGFHFFASAVLVSHAYVHLVEIDAPVSVGGLVVNPGDLIHADQHGAQVIPIDIAAQIPEAAAKIAQNERRIIEACQSQDFSIDKLKQIYNYI